MNVIEILYRLCQIGWICGLIAAGRLWGWGAYLLVLATSAVAVFGVVFDHYRGRPARRRRA